MIGFVIPTWNRANELRTCVESIATQGPHSLVIVDNASTDDTPAVCKELVTKYPFISYVRYGEHVDGADSYKRAVNCAQSDYTWTFGDDDLLLPGALKTVDQIIAATNCAFYHVAESKRVGKAGGITDTVFGICNMIGWLDFTGFMSGNVSRTTLLKAGVNSDNWGVYRTSSFPQSLAILETMGNEPGMLIQFACLQSADETENTRARWRATDVCWKYLYVGNGLRLLVEQGKIPSSVTEVFFRYLDGMLFCRLMNDFNYRVLSPAHNLQDSDWDCLEFMTGMVAGERGALLTNWVTGVRDTATKHQAELKAFSPLYDRLIGAVTDIQVPAYPITYLPE